jgi:hypothetical protein
MGARAKMETLKTLHTRDPEKLLVSLRKFLSDLAGEGKMPDLLLTGENGDERLLPFFNSVESCFDASIPVARFKHLCGEYCTASSFACWIAIQILTNGKIPSLLIKKEGVSKPVQRILIYNTYRGAQHAFILMSKVS